MVCRNLKNLVRLALFVAFFLSIPYIVCAEESKLSEKKDDSKKINIDTRTGYKKASLNWNISAPDNSPNVMSELEYNNLGIVETGVDMTAVVHQIYSRASISFGKIVDGDGVDTDYNQDNRGELEAQSESEVYDNIHALCVGLGYQFDVTSKKNIKISPVAGVSYQAQNLRQRNGVQTVSSGAEFPSQGQVLTGLNSTYDVEWKSWFLGVDFVYEVFKNMYLSSTVEYHNAQYAAEADWNLRDDFAHPVSFVHEAEGTGSKINVGINRLFAQRWLIGLLYDWQQWSADSGDDILYWSEGGETKSKLNQVNWGSQSINLSIGFSF